MKKTLSILTALMILLCSFIMTSCQHTVVADEDTWYKTEKSFSGVDVNLWFYYSQKQLTVKTKNEGTQTFDPGLTIVVCPVGDVGGVSVAAYTIKNLPAGVEVTIEEDENTTIPAGMKIKANGTMMDALYVANKAQFRESAGKIPGCFELLNYKENITDFADLGSGLEQLKGKGWKSLIKEAINQLL